MLAEILSVGTELLMGQIANTDAQFISRRLSELGISIYRHTTVGDNPKRIKDAIHEALSRCDIVITTGGLGPTEDDLTKEMAAEVFGLPLVLHKPSLEAMTAYMEKAGRPMTVNNMKQAYFPENCTVLENLCGTAPGCIMEKNGKMIVVLPGPPHELMEMFDLQLAPYLSRKSGSHIESVFLHEFGIGESMLETKLKDLFHTDNPTLALYCAPGEVLARVTASASTSEEALARIRPLESEVIRRMGECFYGRGIDLTLPKAVLNALRVRGETVCTAESCTGGLIASSIIEYSGASDVVKESYITYCDEAKHKILGVSEDTLSRYTAVSRECAIEMAEGARRISGADWGVSATGYAGPGGAQDGLVYIGVSGKDRTVVKEFRFAGSRERIRLLAARNALNLLRLEMDTRD